MREGVLEIHTFRQNSVGAIVQAHFKGVGDWSSGVDIDDVIVEFLEVASEAVTSGTTYPLLHAPTGALRLTTQACRTVRRSPLSRPPAHLRHAPARQGRTPQVRPRASRTRQYSHITLDTYWHVISGMGDATTRAMEDALEGDQEGVQGAGDA